MFNELFIQWFWDDVTTKPLKFLSKTVNFCINLEVSISFSLWMLAFYHLSILVWFCCYLKLCFYLFWICLCLLLKMLGSCWWSSGWSLVPSNRLLDQCHWTSYVGAVHVVPHNFCNLVFWLFRLFQLFQLFRNWMFNCLTKIWLFI